MYALISEASSLEMWPLRNLWHQGTESRRGWLVAKRLDMLAWRGHALVLHEQQLRFESRVEDRALVLARAVLERSQ